MDHRACTDGFAASRDGKILAGELFFAARDLKLDHAFFLFAKNDLGPNYFFQLSGHGNDLRAERAGRRFGRAISEF